MNKEQLKQEQPIVYQTLSNALRKKRLSHAYLFVGPKGSPKNEVALLWAQSLMCSHPDEDGFACQTCEQCQRIQKEESVDFCWIHGSQESIKKRQIVELQEKFSQTSLEENDIRVYILEQFDQATPDASNSLLKFLEEPREGIYGILTADEKTNVLPTIQSRCQWVQFRPASKQRLKEQFQEKDPVLVEYLVECGYTQDQIEEYIDQMEVKTILAAANQYCSTWKTMQGIYEMQTKIFVPKQALTNKIWVRMFLQFVYYKVTHQKVEVSLDQRVRLQTCLLEAMDTLYRPVDISLLLDRIYYEIYQILCD